jgi:RimJ/RimL family protein N-acetyltransferase
MKTFLLGRDVEVAAWAFKTFNFHPTHYCMAVGIIEDHGLVAACMFHAHNGPDVELSYYGPKTLTLDVVKGLAKIAVEHLGVSRITARTSRANKTITRGIKGVGFQYEGVRKCGYGDQDAIMYGLYGRNLAKLAGRALH